MILATDKKYIHSFTSAVVLCKHGCSVMFEDCISEPKANAIQRSVWS